MNKTNNNRSCKEPKQQHIHSKNEEIASNNKGSQQQTMEIITMISYIEETMKTLKNFRKRLKAQLESNLIL